MLLEHDGLHVRLLDHRVDDRELGLRELLGDLLQRRLLAEAHGHDRREAVAGEAAQRLLALGVVLRLEIAVVGAGVLLELLGALIDALVEGLVELAAEIVDDCGLEGGLLREGSGGGKGEAREREAELGDCHRLCSLLDAGLLPVAP